MRAGLNIGDRQSLVHGPTSGPTAPHPDQRPHNHTSGLGLLANLHVTCAVVGGSFLEAGRT